MTFSAMHNYLRTNIIEKSKGLSKVFNNSKGITITTVVQQTVVRFTMFNQFRGVRVQGRPSTG